MSITKDQRTRSWNVEVWSGSWCLAGVYQSANLLLVADVAYELDLCLILEHPDDNTTPWQPALLSKDTRGSLIVLDQHDNSPFPTPVDEQINCYHYVLHSSECTRTARDPHCLAGLLRLPVSLALQLIAFRYMYPNPSPIAKATG